MTTDEQLFAAVVAAPDDDAPRLVYADFLEEQGRLEQATFVRAQLAAQGQPVWSVAALLADNAARRGFSTPTLNRFHVWPSATTWKRGFPSMVQCTFAEALRLDERALTLVDTLAVNVQGVDDLRPLVRQPWFRQLRSLRLFADACDERVVQPLLDCHLDALALRPTASALTALLTSPLGARLRSVDLNNSFFHSFGRPLLDAFAAAPTLPRLRALDLGDNNVTAEALTAVLARVPVLDHLDLSHCVEGTSVPETLAHWSGLPQLQSLSLASSRPRTAGLEALANAGAPLRMLNLHHAVVGPRGLRVLARFSHLALLNVSQDPLTAEALAAFECPTLVGLCLDDVAVRRPLTLPGLTALRFLSLTGDAEPGFERLRWPTFP